MPCARCARVNLGAIERNVRAAAARAAPRARAVRGRQGRRLRPRRRAGRARRAAPAARPGWRSPPPPRRASCATAGIATRRSSCMGALTRGARRALAADADVVAWRERARRRAWPPRRRRAVHVKLDTGMGRLGHARPRARRRGSPAPPRPRRARAGRRDDALRHRRRAAATRSSASSSRASAPGRGRCARAHPGLVAARRQQRRRRCATRRAHFDLVRSGVAIYGLDPFGEDPRRARPRAGARAASYVAAVKPMRAGGERRLRPALRRRAPDTALATRADRLRRRLAPRAHQQRRRARRAAARLPLVGTVSMDNITVDARRRRRPPAVGRRGGADRRAGRRADHRRGARAAAGHDQLRDHLRAHRARAARAPPRRRAGVSERAGRVARARCAGERRVARRRRGARPPARPRRSTTSTSSSTATPRGRRAARRAAPRGGPAFALSEEFGAWRVIGAGRGLAGRPHAAAAAARWTRTCARATSPSTRSPSRSPAATLVDPHGGAADLAARRLRMVGRARVRRRPAARRCGSRASPASWASSPTPRHGGRGARSRAAGSPASPPSASSPSCKRVRRRRRGARGPRADGRRSALTASCCPSSPRCAASSRTATTTSTSTTTRSRCSRRRSRSSATRPRRSAPSTPTRCARCSPSRWPTSSPAATALRFGALLHDVAKPATRAMRDDGEVGRLPRPRPSRARELARDVLAPAAGQRAAARARRGARPPPPAPRLPRARARRSTGARSTATSRDRARSRSTSRCCRSPTASRRAGARPRRRSSATSSSPASVLPRRAGLAGAGGRRRRRSCAATSWPPSSASTPGRSSAQLLRARREARYAGEVTTRDEARRARARACVLARPEPLRSTPSDDRRRRRARSA